MFLNGRNTTPCSGAQTRHFSNSHRVGKSMGQGEGAMAHRKDGCDYESQDDRKGRDSSIAVKRTPGIIHPTSQPGQSGQMSALIKCQKPTIASTAPPTIPMERIDDILLEMRQMLERMQLMVRKVEDQAQYLRPVQEVVPIYEESCNQDLREFSQPNDALYRGSDVDLLDIASISCSTSQVFLQPTDLEACDVVDSEVSLPSASAWIPLTPPTPETTSLDIDSSSKNDFRTPAEVPHDSRIIQSSGIYNWDREDAYG